VLLEHASALEAADARLAPRITADLLESVLHDVPDALLLDPTSRNEFASADAARARYRDYLTTRLLEPRAFVAEAARAQQVRAIEPVQRRSARR
jgi:hypothetical protein